MLLFFYFASNAGYCYPVQVIGKSTNFINTGNIHVEYLTFESWDLMDSFHAHCTSPLLC